MAPENVLMNDYALPESNKGLANQVDADSECKEKLEKLIKIGTERRRANTVLYDMPFGI